VKQLVRSGKIAAGHARLLLGQSNAETIAQEIIEKGLSVRQVEVALRKDDATRVRDAQREARGRAAGAKDANTRALEKRLADSLGLEVSVEHRGEGGTLKIKYRNLEQLDAVLKKLSR
jgi:ParB family chromosome partitioning protein